MQTNDLKAWLIALAIVAGSVVISRIFYFLSTKIIKRIFEKTRGRLMYIIFDMLEEPAAMLIIIGGIYYAQRRLSFAQSVDVIVDRVIVFAVILTVTWAVARLLDDLISQYLVPAVAKSDSKLDDQLLPVIRKGTKFLIWVVGIVVALDNAGYDVRTIVAGLGIGGLAFAFAAQETIANFFGGVTVFIDAPFRIGDRIKITGYEGFVREIGLRTAKLETLDGRQLTMPNSVFSKNVIENVSSEPATKVVQNIGIACSQNADRVEKAIELAREVVAADPDLEPNSVVWFKEFADSAYTISLVLWIKKGADYFGVQTRVYLAVIRSYEAAGIELALPTRLIVKP